MSRVPRAYEHLKTGFAAEAASAARFRAFAAQAESEGKSQLAAEWMRLAEAKDELAIRQLRAAGQIRPEATSIADALAEERYENDVLYPKMIREAGGKAAETLTAVVEAQKEHAERLSRLRRAVQASSGDIEPIDAAVETSAS